VVTPYQTHLQTVECINREGGLERAEMEMNQRAEKDGSKTPAGTQEGLKNYSLRALQLNKAPKKGKTIPDRLEIRRARKRKLHPRLERGGQRGGRRTSTRSHSHAEAA